MNDLIPFHATDGYFMYKKGFGLADSLGRAGGLDRTGGVGLDPRGAGGTGLAVVTP